MSKIKTNKSLYARSKEFLLANMWVLWIVIAANLMWNVSVSTLQNNRLDTAVYELKVVADQISGGIVMLDALGRPIVATPKKLTPLNPAFKTAINNYIKMYGFYDWSKLTDNFRNKVTSADDVYEKNEDIALFKKEFFEKNSRAEREFDGYITQLVFMINKNKLPETISIVSEKITGFKVDGDSFEIKVDYTVLASIYDGNTETYLNKEGHIGINAAGRMNPAQGSIDNPLGIVFDSAFKPTILEK